MATIIATRSLVLQDNDRNVEIPIRIYAPERAKTDWICRFDIEWPQGRVERWGAGIDAVQSLWIALQMIGAEIYTSRHHESGRLSWLTPGCGYGFPVPKNIRDLLVGDDKSFL
jgi:Domain of unknown function (DUF6968)